MLVETKFNVDYDLAKLAVVELLQISCRGVSVVSLNLVKLFKAQTTLAERIFR